MPSLTDIVYLFHFSRKTYFKNAFTRISPVIFLMFLVKSKEKLILRTTFKDRMY